MRAAAPLRRVTLRARARATVGRYYESRIRLYQLNEEQEYEVQHLKHLQLLQYKLKWGKMLLWL